MTTLSAPTLAALLARSFASHPDRPALHEPDGATISYRDLDRLSGRVRDVLIARGVSRGDRVGVFLPKSIDTVAVIAGALRVGAAYVPIDPGSPLPRAGFILSDCRVKVVVTLERLRQPLAAVLSPDHRPEIIALGEVGGGRGLGWLDGPRSDDGDLPGDPDDLAYLLYTSGSTGQPKGVMLTHRAAISFVDWCAGVFEPTADDRCSSHAPFHFDLSILDLWLSLGAGARVTLLGEEIGKDPVRLARVLEQEQLTIWYSTPSILSLITQHGGLADRDLSRLRLILFAGEVYPMPGLRALMAAAPGPRYFNLYGPTETNVCTYYQVPREIPETRTAPVPIGRVCEHLQGRVVDPDGHQVPPGAEGELVITGPGVMNGYWNLAERNAVAFLVDENGVRWYRTGDLVVEDPELGFEFHGRRDRMVKRRGYRIELGEIEAALAGHPEVREVGVVARQDETAGTHIRAYLATTNGQRLSIIALKRFCTERLPASMIPDSFAFLEGLPKTSTDKTDYQRLRESHPAS